jgi:hypothetical protein
VTSFSGPKRSDRLRRTGWLVLTAGLVSAAVFYWLEVRSANPALDDSTAFGFTRSLHHQMGAMMGQMGLILTDWQEILTSPLGEALMIAICAALLAAYFFRVAWVLDHDEQN